MLVKAKDKRTSLKITPMERLSLDVLEAKTTAVRIIPVPGKGPGETVEWGGLLGTAIAQDPGEFGCGLFAARGGRIPAPLQGYRN